MEAGGALRFSLVFASNDRSRGGLVTRYKFVCENESAHKAWRESPALQPPTVNSRLTSADPPPPLSYPSVVSHIRLASGTYTLDKITRYVPNYLLGRLVDKHSVSINKDQPVPMDTFDGALLFTDISGCDFRPILDFQLIIPPFGLMFRSNWAPAGSRHSRSASQASMAKRKDQSTSTATLTSFSRR